MNKWGDILTEIFDFGKIDNESKVYLLKITNKSGAFATLIKGYLLNFKMFNVIG